MDINPVNKSKYEKRDEQETFKLKATRELLATDHVIFNYGQVTWTTPELAPPLLNTTPMGGRFSSRHGYQLSTRWVLSGTGLELVTWQATIRYLYHSATAATGLLRKCRFKWMIRASD
ncbi:uncharacterized protein TNCV_2328511 [Trichonephila clavipes]|nr:uncharacterized protein TNCV_2328511 [Trichonephila clavipes]